jgi:plastocyanin
MKTRNSVAPYLLASVLAIMVPLTAWPAETHVVEIKNFKFNPQDITIKSGDTVRWINKEKRGYHNAWFEQLGEPEPDYLFPEDSYDKTFSQAGDFPYRCGPHPEMTGIVHVTE